MALTRILLATGGTAVGVVALVAVKSGGRPLQPTGGLPVASLPQTTTTVPPTSGSTAGSPSGSASSPVSSAAPASTGRSGTFTGTAITTQYGIVQVRVAVSGGRIVRANFVQLTAFDGHSQEINSYAGPILLQETLKAQSAKVDTVSGASYTSDGYRQSLQSALDHAGL